MFEVVASKIPWPASVGMSRITTTMTIRGAMVTIIQFSIMLAMGIIASQR